MARVDARAEDDWMRRCAAHGGWMDLTLDRIDTTDGRRWRRIPTDENHHLRFNRARAGEFTKNDGGKVAKVSREHPQKRRRGPWSDEEEGFRRRTGDARVLRLRRDRVVAVANHSNGVRGGSDVNGGDYEGCAFLFDVVYEYLKYWRRRMRESVRFGALYVIN